MRGSHSLSDLAVCGSEDCVPISEKGLDPWLVDCEPQPDPVAEGIRHDPGVIGKTQSGLPVRPTSLGLQVLGEVEVVQRHHRLDAFGQEEVEQAPVVVEAGLVDASVRFWLHARPGDREAVPAKRQVGDEIDVGFQAVVVIAGDVAVIAPVGGAGPVAPYVPQARTTSVRCDRALDLVRGGRRAPKEAVGENKPVAHQSFSFGRAGCARRPSPVRHTRLTLETERSLTSRSVQRQCLLARVWRPEMRQGEQTAFADRLAT